MSPLIKQLKAIWGRMNTGQHLLAGLILLFAVAGAVGAAFWGGTASYRLLKSGLDRETAAKALTRLDEAAVRYKLENEGRDILVDARDFERAQTVAVQAQLFPADGDAMGYKSLTSMNFGLTEEQQKLRVRIATEEEIARSVKQFDGIEAVKVHLVPAERSFNRKDSLPAKASVVVRLRAGKVLDPGSVEAMAAVVANAAPGLARSGVIITDTAGNLLSSPTREGNEGIASFSQTRSREQYLVEKAQSALDAALGPNRAIVRVDAVIESESTENTTVTPKIDGKVTLQEKTSNSTEAGSSKPAGPPASATNPDGGAAAAAGGTKEENSATYDYPRETTHVTKERASVIKRLTVGVILDDALRQLKQQVENIVKGAVGFDEKRPDFIEVALVPFAAPVKPTEVVLPSEPGPFTMPSIIEMVKWGTTAIAAVIIGILLLKSVRSARVSMQTAFTTVQTDRPTEARRADPAELISQEIDRDAQAVGKLLRNWLYETAKN